MHFSLSGRIINEHYQYIMLSTLSLKYRIALVIFALEAVMMTVVLWQTLSSSLDATRQLHADNEKVMLQLLADLSSTALLIEELADVQLYFQQVLQQPTVKRVLLADVNDRVVASSNVADVGGPLPTFRDSSDRYWRSQPVITAAGNLGLLAIEFSNKALVEANIEARNLGVAIAAIGMSIILVVGVVVGYALTRRLDRITGAARRFAEGNYDTQSGVRGGDELGALGLTFDQMVRDVAQKQQQLSEQSQHIRLLMNSTAEAIYGVDRDGICVFVNPACLSILGYDDEEQLLGKNIADIIQFTNPERVAPPTPNPVNQTIRTGQPTHSDQSVCQRADDSEFPVEYWAHAMRRDNTVVGAVVTFIDITERRRAEDELKQHRENLEGLVAQRTATVRDQAHILNQIHDSVVTTDLDGMVTSWNRGAERLFGFETSEAMGQHISFIYPPEEHDFLANKIIAPLKAKGEHEVEVKMRRSNGEVFSALQSLSMLYEADGAPKGMVNYSLDITAQKKAEALAIKRADELAALNQELESFSYSVSHDLRAPLRSIDGFSLALLEDYGKQFDSTGTDYLQRVRAAAQRMAKLIDDLLDLSRMSRGQVNREKISLSNIANEIADNMKENEPKRQVKFEIDPNLEAYADASLIRVVLQNLFGNAWKYTSNNAIAHIELGEMPHNSETVFYVRDDGVGFDMQYADKLFGAFQRLHKANEFEGTGIGLATVQRIIHRHGGIIWAQSEPNEGATFYFTLPEDDI
jgi:PAS domain S-box-containing protein